jgi:hypothetical protein
MISATAVAVSTAAVPIFNGASCNLTITSTAGSTVFIGGSAVSTLNGAPLPAGVAVPLGLVTGSLFAIATGATTIGVITSNTYG